MFAPALSVLVFLTGTVVTAQPMSAPKETAPARRTVTLSMEGQRNVPELSMGPELLTTLLFSAPLRLADVEVEEWEHFSRVTKLEDALLLVPSPSLAADRRLRLRVRFVEGTVPASADFLLVMDATRTESHQVNVELRRLPADRCEEAEVELRKAQQCQAELELMRQQPRELTGLLATNLMDEQGVNARELSRLAFTQSLEEPIRVKRVWTYRAARRVAVELRVTNRSRHPWTVADAELVGKSGERLQVLRVWPGEPLAPGEAKQRVLVEADATGTEARGQFKLSLHEDGEPASVTVDGVVFP